MMMNTLHLKLRYCFTIINNRIYQNKPFNKADCEFFWESEDCPCDDLTVVKGIFIKIQYDVPASMTQLEDLRETRESFILSILDKIHAHEKEKKIRSTEQKFGQR